MNIGFVQLNMQDFFKKVVFPVFDDLKKEIEQYGRSVVIDVDNAGFISASMTVYAPLDNDTDTKAEEFYFEIRGKAYQKAGFAFPAHADEDQPRIPRVEIVFQNNITHEYDIKELSGDDIIECFIDEYSKWAKY